MATYVVVHGAWHGGMVITGVADRMADRIKSLVYLDAFVPEHGDSLIGLLNKALVPEVAAAFVGGFRGPALEGHAGQTQPIPADGWDPSPFRHFAAKFDKAPGWRVTKLPCSHDVMVDLPKDLAKELLTLA